ncbi:MAG TPA: hypothetical protein VFP94_00275 [Terriglobales bacterium]|nr:hypothetical protein [Terriglobales bacterium]
MADLTSLIRTLTDKTEQGRVPWQKTPDEHTVRATLPDGAAFDLYCDQSEVGLTTRDASGAPVPALTATKLGAFMPNQAVLAQLATVAFRAAATSGDDREKQIVNAVGRL